MTALQKAYRNYQRRYRKPVKNLALDTPLFFTQLFLSVNGEEYHFTGHTPDYRIEGHFCQRRRRMDSIRLDWSERLGSELWAALEITPLIPSNTAECVDAYYKLQQQRLAKGREVKRLEEIERRLKESLIQTIPKSKATGIRGQVAQAVVNTDEVPVVDDQEKLWKYLQRTKNYHLVNNLKASSPAVKELWNEGKSVPGVGKFTVTKLSLRKV